MLKYLVQIAFLQESMEKLDLKDRKILYELDIDSRQSFAQLGKKVGLHKDVVAYRVKKLQERGVIKNFYVDINGYKLGYNKIKFYYNFQFITPEIKQEIIDYLVKSPYTDVVHSAEGQYDLVVICEVENIPNFYNIWNGVINRYRDFFSNQIFCIHNMLIEYKRNFLLDENTDTKGTRILFIESARDEKAVIDNLDKGILELLAPNSRIKTIDIAEKLHATVNTINSRIKKLETTGVIQRYTITIDWPKIGYQWYKADVVLKDPTKMQKIVGYIENNPHLIHRIASLGYVDLELTFALNNANQLHQIIEDVSLKFPESIKNYKYFSITKTHKYSEEVLWKK
jgi:Lrp/AsnC family leucine-responsive transcriptional regulator